MPETPTPNPKAAARVREALATHYARTHAGVRAGLLDTHAARLDVPPRSEHARTFVFSFLLPFSLLRIMWRDRPLRARFISRLKPPFAMLLGIAVLLALHVARVLPGPVDDVVEGIGGALKGAYELAQSLPSPFASFMDSGDEDDEKESRGHRGQSARRAAAAARERATRDPLAKPASNADSADDEDETDAGVAEEIAAANAETAEVLGEVMNTLSATGLLRDGGAAQLAAVLEETRARSEHAAVDAGAQESVEGKKHSKERIKTRLASKVTKDDAWDVLSFAGALLALEWILVWIGREHHDLISHDVSVLAGIPAEPLQRHPKLRWDIAYVAMKGWRALRFVLFVFLALPVVAVSVFALKIVCLILHASFIGKVIANVLFALVGIVAVIYWSAVFGAANAFVAWEPPPPGWTPSFMRGLAEIGRIPVLGWPARVYSRFVARVTRKVWPACYAFELAPLESIAMTAGKLVAVVPGMYLVLRPFFGPAATHLIHARRREVVRIQGTEAQG
jgi:hypothetical protein